MSYSAQNIRNICLLGHSGVGKTMLVESMLNLTGATDRLGKTADGNTVCDSPWVPSGPIRRSRHGICPA